MNRSPRLALALGLAAAAMMSPAAASADLVTLHDTKIINLTQYLGTQSNWIREDSPTTPLSNNAILRVGSQGTGSLRRGFIRFTDLDAGFLGFNDSQITAATLTFTTDGSFQGSGTIELRVLGASDIDWVENQISWNNKSTGNAWAGGGGAGSNFGAVIDSEAWTTSTTTVTFDLTGTALAVVKNWVNGSDPDAGFILTQQNEDSNVNYIDFISEDNFSGPPSTAFPTLAITYQVPEPASLAMLGFACLAMLGNKRK